ncbi:MAG: tetratricopeptide repeat protein [Pseudomonadota bacterium]
MSQPEDSFLREVQEEVRRERLARAFDKYGVAALVGAAVIVAGVVGWQWYNAYTTDIAQKAGARFAAAQRLLRSEEAKDKQTAFKDFQEIAATGPANYQALAQLQIAARHLDENKTDEAKAAFAAVTKIEDIDPALTSYARLQLVTIDADTLDYNQLQDRLKPLMGQDVIWRYSARELLAARAVAAGRKDDARPLLAELLSDQQAPASIRQRAEMLMGIITVPESKPAPKSEGKTETAPKPDAETPTQSEPAKTTPQPTSGASNTQSDATQAKDSPKADGDTKKPEKEGSASSN